MIFRFLRRWYKYVRKTFAYYTRYALISFIQWDIFDPNPIPEPRPNKMITPPLHPPPKHPVLSPVNYIIFFMY